MGDWGEIPWQILCFLNLSSKDTCMLHHGMFHMLARHRICMIGPPLRRFVLSRCFPPLLQPFHFVGPQSEEGRLSAEIRSSHTYFDDYNSSWSVLQLAHKQYVIRCKFDWSACTKLRKVYTLVASSDGEPYLWRSWRGRVQELFTGERRTWSFPSTQVHWEIWSDWEARKGELRPCVQSERPKNKGSVRSQAGGVQRKQHEGSTLIRLIV